MVCLNHTPKVHRMEDSFGSSDGPDSGGERVFSMCRALSKTCFLKETVTLLKLALPVVSVISLGLDGAPGARPSASKIKPPAGRDKSATSFAAANEWAQTDPTLLYSLVCWKVWIYHRAECSRYGYKPIASWYII